MEKLLLPPLKGKFTHRQVWDLKSVPQIKEFLHALYQNPGEHSVAPEKEVQFMKVVKDILDFDFSKGVVTFPTSKLYTLNDTPFRAFSPFDSLAHMFSLTKAPKGATRENFYFALAANVARMFVILGGVNCPARTSIIFEEPAEESGPIPLVISTDDFVIGSSIPKADSKKIIQESRCEWMYKLTGNQMFADPTTSLLNPEGRRKGRQLFGHCAETYAFIFKLHLTDPSERKYLAGFTLRNEKISQLESLDDLFSLHARRICVQNPCLNCMKAIIEYYNADPKKFMVEAEEYFNFGATVPPK